MLLAWSNVDLKAQETITNAFDDLKRTGTVNEQDSEMRQATSDTALQKLLTQKPAAGYFCFAEDRMHDIRLDQIIPARWTERVFDTWLQLKGDCQPGEFYTWQIGVFTPFKELKGVSVSFSDLVKAQIPTDKHSGKPSVSLKDMYRHSGSGWTSLHQPKGYIKEKLL